MIRAFTTEARPIDLAGEMDLIEEVLSARGFRELVEASLDELVLTRRPALSALLDTFARGRDI